MNARFVKLVWENEARTIGSLFFKPDGPYYFTAGQYASLHVPHDPRDDRGQSRTMTFSSSPNDKVLRITTRFWKQNQSSYKNTLQALSPGAMVTLTDAMGDMVAPLDESIPLVFVAGGIGIASFVSIVQWLTEQHDVRDITLLYAVRDTRDIIFQKEFDDYSSIGKLKIVLFTTDNKLFEKNWLGEIRTTRLKAQNIIDVLQPNSQIYISGTEAMVEQLTHELQDTYKIPQYRIAFDFFDGYNSEI